MELPELKAAILDALDVQREFELLGVRFPSGAKDTNGSGRIRCHAMGREDNKPSAVVNIITGFYQDYGGDGDAMTFWDFAARYGGHDDWLGALKHYAKKTGLAKRLPKKFDNAPSDNLSFTAWNPLACRGVCKLYGVQHGTLNLLGSKLASYPKKSPSPQYVVALPAYGPLLTAAPPVGYVCQAANGKSVDLYRGKGNRTEPVTRVTQGKSGLLGRHALKRIANHPGDIKRIYKVEGFSDMLKLQDMIPTEKRDEVLVCTNAGGATETTLPPIVAPVFQGIEVCVIHDADQPGETGAKFWCGELIKAGVETVRHVRLPYEIEESKGKDIRDWFAAGNDFLDLQRLADSTKPIEKDEESSQDPQTLSATDAILNSLGISVLGHRDRVITCFSRKHGRLFEINGISRYKVQELVLDVGGDCLDYINTTPEPAPGKFTFSQITTAIASAASRKRLTDSNQRGVGIWDLNDRLVLVNAGEAALFNGKLERTLIPKVKDIQLQFGEGPNDKWFEFDWLKSKLEEATPEWCASVFQDLVRLIECWDNWKYADTPELAAALVMATWVQSIWPWRPTVAITGGTGTGKTVFMDGLLRHFFQDDKMSLATTKASEAAIRQHILNTSRVILIDEFEADDKRQKILELFRTSSRGTRIIRGSSCQKGVSFGLQHIPWVGAIELGMDHAADRNRYIVLDLEKIDPNKKSTLSLPSQYDIQKLGMHSMVAIVACYREALAINDALRKNPIPNHDRRITESFSVPAATMGAVLGFDTTQSRNLVEQFVANRAIEHQQVSDEEQLLRTIWESKIRLPSGQDDTVGNLAIAVDGRTQLEKYGIRICTDAAFFSPSLISRYLLTGTKYEHCNIGQILCRIPGADSKPRPRMGGSQPRGVTIPMCSINKLLNDES